MILVVGDIHAAWGRFNQLIREQQPDMILQCGDFGFWPGHRFYDPATKLQPGSTLVHWIDGNHDDHYAIQARLKANQLFLSDELPDVVFQPRGSIVTLPDGRTVLFAGGAFSVDNRIRLPGKDWFPDLEILTEEDLKRFPDPDSIKIDIVISHTAPNEFSAKGLPLEQWPDWWDQDKDPSADILSKVLQAYKPSQWFFGHFHLYQEGSYNGCDWYGLDHARGDTRWWMELPTGSDY